MNKKEKETIKKIKRICYCIDTTNTCEVNIYLKEILGICNKLLRGVK